MSLQLPLLQPDSGKFPSFKQAVDALGIVPEILYRALEFGTSQNRLFFEQLSEKERPRPHIREIIVRDQAKRFLQRNDFQVEDEVINVGGEPLAALLTRWGPVQIRTLKAISGLVPGCGDSFKRRRFYNQLPDLYLGRDGKTRQTRLNLLFLWDFDPTFNLGNVWLSLPLRAGENSADVVTFWHEPLPHPATLAPDVKAGTARQEAEDELEKLLRDDEQKPEDEEESG